MVWIDGNFYNLSAPFHQDQRYTVYYFQETSVKLVYLEDLSTGIGIIPEPTAITGATERVQELTNVSYTNGIRSFIIFCPIWGKTNPIRISNWWTSIPQTAL